VVVVIAALPNVTVVVYSFLVFELLFVLLLVILLIVVVLLVVVLLVVVLLVVVLLVVVLLVVVLLVVVLTTGTWPGNVHFWQALSVAPVCKVRVSAQGSVGVPTLRAAPTSTASSLRAGESVASMQSSWVTEKEKPAGIVATHLPAPRPVQSICREHETGGFVPR